MSPTTPKDTTGRLAWLWWGVIAVALFGSASAILYLPPASTTLLAVTLVVGIIAVLAATTKLNRLWPHLRPRAKALPPVVVAVLAVCFVWGWYSQPMLGDVPLLVGSEKAREVEVLDELGNAVVATVKDASLARLSDEQVRAQTALFEAAISLRRNNASIWVSAQPPARLRQAVETQARLDDAAAVLLNARAALALQGNSPGRQADLRNAAAVFDQTLAEQLTLLDRNAAELGYGSTRAWDEVRSIVDPGPTPSSTSPSAPTTTTPSTTTTPPTTTTPSTTTTAVPPAWTPATRGR